MTDIELKQMVLQRVVELITLFHNSWYGNSSLYFQQDIEIPTIKYTKRGKCSGCVTYVGDNASFNFNMTLLRENTEKFIAQTVAHEVSHYCVWLFYGHLYSKGRRIIHGREWEKVMVFFGASPNRCHGFNTDNCTRKQLKQFTYKCNCTTHKLTSIRHNKIIKGKGSYVCKTCNGRLVFVGL